MRRGIKVTVVQGNKQVLPQIDYEMACFLHSELRAKGVTLALSSRVTSLESREGGVTVHTDGGSFCGRFFHSCARRASRNSPCGGGGA